MVLDGFSIPRICKIRVLICAKSKAMITQTAVQFKNLNFFTHISGRVFFSFGILIYTLPSTLLSVSPRPGLGLGDLIYNLNPPAALLDVPPRLRRRPHTGALGLWLLLLGAGCGERASTAAIWAGNCHFVSFYLNKV